MTSFMFGGYGAQTLATVTGLGTAPDSTTTAVRTSYTAGAGNPGVIIMPIPDVSTQYTVSAYVYNEGSVDESIAIALKGSSSGGTQVVPPGVWTRLSWTMTTPSSLGSGNDFGVRIGSPAATGSFLTTNVLIEKSNVLFPWFYGGMSAGGDFTYAWTGPTNNSTSTQRGINLLTFGVGSASAVIQSTDWSASGTKSIRSIPTSTSQDSFITVSAGTLKNGTYTVLATLRMTGAQTSPETRARRIVAYHSASSDLSTPAPNAMGVYPMRLVFKVTDSSVYQNIRLYNGAARGNGEVWWDNVMVVEGDYQGDYIDGTKPFSKWYGTANASTSVGYPPQLFDIAGKPALEQYGAGTTANPTVDGFVARTLYVVYEVFDANAAWQVPMYYGSGAPNDGVTLQTAAAGSLSMSPRFDFNMGGGDINKGAGIGNARTPNRVHVMAISMNQGLTLASFTTDGVTNSNLTLNPGTVGLTSGQLRCYTPATIKNIRSMVYYEAHDVATRLAISRYLGNKYGAAVA